MKATNIGLLISHLAGDVSHLVHDLKTYEMGLANPPQISLPTSDWENRIEQSLERAESIQQILSVCGLLFMNPELCAKAEMEIDTSNPKDALTNLIAFYKNNSK